MYGTGLEVQGLVKRFPGFQLGPITFELAPRAICGLLGPNGAGKTTLLDCLAGQSRPDDGSFGWESRVIRWGDWKYRGGICFIREQPAFYDELTVDQTIRFASSMYTDWKESFAREWTSRLRLPLWKKIRALSKGMKVKLALIVGLGHDARLLLLDEPTTGLDPDARAELHELLPRLVKERGASLLLSSHLFEDIEQVCDEVRILRDGRLELHARLTGAPVRNSVREIYFTMGR